MRSTVERKDRWQPRKLLQTVENANLSLGADEQGLLHLACQNKDLGGSAC
jgi:hypothetical protein